MKLIYIKYKWTFCPISYSRNVSYAQNLISTFILLSLVDNSAGGQLVPEGIIRPVVSALAPIWFIRYTFLYLFFYISKF